MLQSHLMALQLGYTHLVHVDRLLTMASQKLRGKRPDFVAVSMGTGPATTYGATWEAKGRTNGFDDTALTKAKAQATKAPTIAGLAPVEAIASEAYFDKDDHTWRAALRDPDWDGDYLKAGLETYLTAYYRPILEAAREGGSSNTDNGLRVLRIPSLDLTLTLPEPLAEAVDASFELPLEAREAEQAVSATFRSLAEELGPEWRPDLLHVALDDNARPFVGRDE